MCYKTKVLKRSKNLYITSLAKIRVQYGITKVVRLTKLYMNEAGRIYAGEWIDDEGVTNFNSGYILELDTIIQIID